MKTSPILGKIARFLRDQKTSPSLYQESTPLDATFPHLSIRIESVDKASIPRATLFYYGIHETPFGKWLVVVFQEKICAISFLRGNLADQLQEISEKWNNARLVFDESITTPLISKILDKNKKSDITLLMFGTPFQLAVWKELLLIGYGWVVSYGDIARAIGKPRAVRAVGTAVGHNPVAYLVPCHRVVTGDGHIGQYFWGTDLKISLLSSELLSEITP